MGNAHAQTLLNRLEGDANAGNTAAEGAPRLLIAADQVVGNSIREALRLMGTEYAIDAASFFDWEPSLAEEGDIHLDTEAQYLELLASGRWAAIAGDPMLLDVPSAPEKKISLPHPAVSGRLEWKSVPRFISQGEELLEALLK